MGIAWFWHVTRTAAPDALKVANEARAASAYARWRAARERLSPLFGRARGVRRERIAGGELDALPDALLRDVGLRRDGDGTIVPERRPQEPPHRPIAGSPVPDDVGRRRAREENGRAEPGRCARSVRERSVAGYGRVSR